MSTTQRGRVRAGIGGFHPGLQQDLLPGMEYDVPVSIWSDDLFEAVLPEVPVAPVEAEVRPLRGRRVFGENTEKEG